MERNGKNIVSKEYCTMYKKKLVITPKYHDHMKLENILGLTL